MSGKIRTGLQRLLIRLQRARRAIAKGAEQVERFLEADLYTSESTLIDVVGEIDSHDRSTHACGVPEANAGTERVMESGG